MRLPVTRYATTTPNLGTNLARPGGFALVAERRHDHAAHASDARRVTENWQTHNAKRGFPRPDLELSRRVFELAVPSQLGYVRPTMNLRPRSLTTAWLCGGILIALASTSRAQTPDGAPSRLRFVAEARQLGPVGYRDPIGVISPDGQWLAFASSGRLQLTPVAGGAVIMLGPRVGAIPSIVWRPDSRHVAALEVDGENTSWWLFDVPTGSRRALWSTLFPKAATGGDSVAIDPNRFRWLAWSTDGARLAGIIQQQTGWLLWTGKADGSDGRVHVSPTRLSYLAWSLDGKTLACLIASKSGQQVSLPCGSPPAATDGIQTYGPIAFSPDGARLYFASPNSRGALDLWVRPIGRGAPVRKTNFTRDTYAPSVAKDGRVLFASQDYRVFVAIVPSDGGTIRQLTAFQSETPSWTRDDRSIGFTYGSWRRIIDDFHYPDIAQDLGLVRADGELPAAAPEKVIRASTSEDQGLDWSPNGHWIVLHSHANGLDDVWIQPADGSSAARSITSGGYETGWPRWSPDGAWIAYATEIREGSRMRGTLFTVGIDSARGTVTREARRVPIDRVDGDIDEVEWAAKSDSLVFLASEGLEQRAIYVVGRDGGPARLVHRFASDQNFSGIGVSPDFRWVAFIAPAPDGHFQVFRVPIAGGAPTQITFDPTDKTQPAVSHDGRSIAFAVFSYRMLFWLMEP
jgi:Tol biopolymer transport system component